MRSIVVLHAANSTHLTLFFNVFMIILFCIVMMTILSRQPFILSRRSIGIAYLPLNTTRIRSAFPYYVQNLAIFENNAMEADCITVRVEQNRRRIAAVDGYMMRYELCGWNVVELPHRLWIFSSSSLHHLVSVNFTFPSLVYDSNMNVTREQTDDAPFNEPLSKKMCSDKCTAWCLVQIFGCDQHTKHKLLCVDYKAA